LSYLDTKQALIQQLLTSSINANDIAFENKNFDPKNKSLWYGVYFIPATSDILGKTAESCNEQRGIFQVSVFIKLNSITFDNDQLSAIDNVLSVFKYNTETVYNTQTVSILESTVNNGIETEAWFQRDISINYLTFSTR
jgi:hypothetical protein